MDHLVLFDNSIRSRLDEAVILRPFLMFDRTRERLQVDPPVPKWAAEAAQDVREQLAV